MNLIDMIILLIVATIIFLIILFNVKSHNCENSHCSKCPYNKDCCKKNKNNNNQPIIKNK